MPASALIRFVGLLRSPASWARVGRETVLALDALGARVAVVHRKGFLFDRAFPLPEQIEALAEKGGEADVDLAFLHPSLYGELRAPRKAGMLTWESSVMPADWAAGVDAHLDALFVPSEFVADAARAAGVARVPIHVAPYGVETRVFHPEVAPLTVGELAALGATRLDGGPLPEDLTDRFTILTVAAPHWRKGIMEIAEAYAAAFDSKDPVALIIKTTPPRGTRSRPFEIKKGVRHLFLGNRVPDSGSPVIGTGYGINDEREPKKVSDTFFLDAALARLYRTADAYVCASFGEGFGLSVLEAKACGVPTVAPVWGGLAAFCTEGDTWPVEFALERAGRHQYHDVPEAQVARLSVASIADAMRELFEAHQKRCSGAWPEPVARRVARSLEVAHAHPWQRGARVILDALSALAM